MKIAFIAGLLLSAISLTAEASKWFQIAEPIDGPMYLDESSISKRGALKKAWIRQDLKTAKITEFAPFKQYQSVKGLYNFNCSERTLAISQSIYYSGTGEDVAEFSYPVNTLLFSEVAPDTVGEIMMNYICHHK